MKMHEHPKTSILVAEDDKEVATSLKNALTQRDYEVTLTFDGEAALQRLEEKKFEVVILDLKLPKVGGFQILNHIKTNLPLTKVIVLTAYADLKNSKICKQLGAEHVIAKPYDIEMLFWAIEMVTTVKV
jgi:CheY-like chemotaxis protein